MKKATYALGFAWQTMAIMIACLNYYNIVEFRVNWLTLAAITLMTAIYTVMYAFIVSDGPKDLFMPYYSDEHPPSEKRTALPTIGPILLEISYLFLLTQTVDPIEIEKLGFRLVGLPLSVIWSLCILVDAVVFIAKKNKRIDNILEEAFPKEELLIAEGSAQVTDSGVHPFVSVARALDELEPPL